MATPECITVYVERLQRFHGDYSGLNAKTPLRV